MVRGPYVDKNGTRRGAWSKEEDNKLRDYVLKYGHWNWRQLPKFAGLTRCGKSCRLRWMNYLKPGIKRGNYTPQEEELILELHAQFGSRWSMIANQLPGRIDNDIKNHWNSHLRRRVKVQGPNSSESTADENEDHRSNEEDESESSSRSTVVNSKQIETGSVSSALSCDSTVQLQGSPSGSASMESFWTQPFDTDHDHFHLQIPAYLEEEIMRPFSPYLDEINMDCWLQELML